MMIFTEIILFEASETGQDLLGVPTVELVPIGTFKAARSAWRREELALLDRSLLKTHFKLLSDVPADIARRAAAVEIHGERYALENVLADSGRWRLLVVGELYAG